MNFDFSYLDTAFVNGKVFTVNENDDIAEAVGVKNNKIVFVGKRADLEKIIDENTKVIDLEGRSLTPGFIDSHYHPIFSGMIKPDLESGMVATFFSECKSLAELLDIIKSAVEVRKPGEWFSSLGYNELLFSDEQRHPTIEELDAVAPDNPLQVMHLCGHISMYNTKALEILGVFTPQDAEKFPEDEVEVMDGKLTGMVRGHTHFGLWREITYTEEQQRAGAMFAQQHCLENGITSVHDCGEFNRPSYGIMQKMIREGSFKIRSYMLIHSITGKEDSLEYNDYWLNLGFTTGLGDEKFRVGSCKFMIDGGSSAPSCATREPYSHEPALPREKGWGREETAEYIRKINDAECQATAHAIGDLAVEFMVEGYEKAFKINPRPDLRHRIEHCSIVDQDLISRIAKLNVIPITNPGMFVHTARNYTKYYGERMKYMVALRSMLDTGIKVCISSDTPSGPAGVSVLDGAVNRLDRINNFQADMTQCISVLEALRCATIHGAYASFEEDIKGSIEVGKLADMIILSEDLTTFPKEKLNEVKVDLTMIDGVVEYERD